VCGASGAVAAVVKVRCPCDTRCCLPTDFERLQGSFLQADISTLTKFHVLLGKSAQECYKSLKEGLRTNALSCKAVADG
jgi:hypothetical protein